MDEQSFVTTAAFSSESGGGRQAVLPHFSPRPGVFRGEIIPIYPVPAPQHGMDPGALRA